MDSLKFFASDNNSGAHPRILKALAGVNAGGVAAYGADPHTARAVEAIRGVFGP